MRILTRYILVELGKVFLVSLTLLTGLMTLTLLVHEAVKQGLPPGQIMRLLPYILPGALLFAVPATLLLATTNVYARISGSNEVVAIKSLGISPTVLLWPTLILAFLLSLGTVVLNDVAVSWGRNGVQRVVVEAVEEIAYGMLRTQRRYSGPNFDINVARVDGRRLIRPTLTLEARGDTPTITITAEEAELRNDRQENVLKIVLRNGTAEVEGRLSVQFPDVQEYEIPLSSASETDNSSKSPSRLPLRVIPEERVNQQADIEGYRQELAARAAQQMLCGDFDRLVDSEWETRRRLLAKKQSRLHRLRTEPYRRWSAGFSCFCFVFVGAPMAIWLRNRDFLTSFFLCFFPILLVYYPAMIYAVDACKSGRFPPITVWTGNLLLFIWGAYLLRKVLRY
ncbi:MAG: YjgP/YjgQ family permease [Planctomycetes bacterium]|nr:YjgP/YjgQ family permease [Planctomycetota bacterium]